MVTRGGEEGDLSVEGLVLLSVPGSDVDLGDPHSVAFDKSLRGLLSTAKGFLDGAAGVVSFEEAGRLDEGLPPEVKSYLRPGVDLTGNLFEDAGVVKDVEVGMRVRV